MKIGERDYFGRTKLKSGKIHHTEISSGITYDVYTDVDGLAFRIPRINCEVINRLNKLSERLTGEQKNKLSKELNEMEKKTKILLGQ